MPAGTTRATAALDRAGIPYRTHRYEVSEKVGEGYGEAVAAAIGLPSARVFKTLVAEVDGEAVVGVVPVDRRLSTKALARALGGKRCALAPVAAAERLTGYVIGGISPLGQRRELRLVLDETASSFGTIAVSGGQRGLQLELAPKGLLEATAGTLAPITEG